MKITMGRSWKALTSKIHQPLPLSPRESQRLLRLLNSSFQQQLDRTYPANLEKDAGLQIQSMLTNPLFACKPGTSALPPVSCDRKSNQALGLLNGIMKRPATLFKEQIAAGTATLEMAKLCLQAEYRNCLRAPEVQLRDVLGSSGIGSLVFDWLWASGSGDIETLLEDRDLVRYICPFVFAENHQSRVWRWAQLEWKTNTSKAHSLLLLQLVKAENIYGQGLGPAIYMFIKCMECNQSVDSPHMRYHSAAAWYLTRAVAKSAEVKREDWSLMLRFSSMIKHFANPRSLIVAYHSVHLAKSPSPNVALKYLQGLPSETRIFSKSKIAHIVAMGLRAAEIFLEKGRQNEAIWIMEYLQTQFPNEIGVSSKAQKLSLTQEAVSVHDGSFDEEEALRNLDGLAI